MIHQSRSNRPADPADPETGDSEIGDSETATDGDGPDPGERELDLSNQPEERAANRRGLSPPAAGPPPDDIRAVALRLLLLIGICLTSIIVLTTAVAWFKPGSLNDLIGFFSTLVATLGTLLGGIVAFYFARR